MISTESRHLGVAGVLAGVLAAGIPIASILVIDPGGLSPFGPAKWAAVSSLVLALFATVVFDFRQRRLRYKPSLLLALWGAFILVAGISAMFGLDPLYAWLGTPERHLGVLAWVLCAAAFVAGGLLNHREVHRVAHVSVVVAGIVGMWAVAEALGWEPISLSGAGVRPTATMGSSAYLGAALALLCFASSGFAFARRSWAYGSLAGLAWIALVLTGARAAWFGAVVALVVLAAARWVELKRVQPRRLAGFVGLGLIGLVTLALVSGVAGRAPDLLFDQKGGAQGRLDEWKVAIRVIAAHPVLGVGPEGYRIDFGKHVGEDYEREHGRASLPDRAHSAPLDVGSTTGVLGMGLYLALLAAALKHVWNALRSRDLWRVGTAAGLIAYFAQSVFLFPIAELEPFAWLLVGVVISFGGSKPGPDERDISLNNRSFQTFATSTVGAFAAIAAVVALVAGVLDVVADRNARAMLEGNASGGSASDLRPDVIRYYLADVRVYERSGMANQALVSIEKALDRSPLDPIVRGEQARLLSSRAQATKTDEHISEARRVLESLVKDDPLNAQVLLRVGVIRALDGDAKAEDAWLKAEHLEPKSPAASLNLAALYEQEGNMADARQAAERALKRDPGNQVAKEIIRRLSGTSLEPTP